MNIVIQMQTCDHAQYSICHLILFYFIFGSPHAIVFYHHMPFSSAVPAAATISGFPTAATL